MFVGILSGMVVGYLSGCIVAFILEYYNARGKFLWAYETFDFLTVFDSFQNENRTYRDLLKSSVYSWGSVFCRYVLGLGIASLMWAFAWLLMGVASLYDNTFGKFRLPTIINKFLDTEIF